METRDNNSLSRLGKLANEGLTEDTTGAILRHIESFTDYTDDLKLTDEFGEEFVEAFRQNGDEAVEEFLKKSEGGSGTRLYKEGFDEHLINGTLGNGNKGVVGGHNYDSFKKVLIDAGFDIDDCIINIKKHPTIDGIYEIEYRIPARQYGSNGELEIIPNQYKTIDYPKTVYDPAIISNEQMIQWGKEAMESGTIAERKISGYASNGLKFEGYIDLTTQEITNF